MAITSKWRSLLGSNSWLRWSMGTLWPIAAVIIIIIVANMSMTSHVSVALKSFREFSLRYHGTSHGAKSPACGCFDPDPKVWRGVTFAYNKLTFKPFKTEGGSLTAYQFTSPYPSAVSYVVPIGFEVYTDLITLPNSVPKEAGIEIIGSLPQFYEKYPSEFQSRDASFTLVSDKPVEVYGVSDTPVGAWLPQERSVLSITNPVADGEWLEWSVTEQMNYDPRKRTKVNYERSTDDPNYQPDDVQHPVVDLIGGYFIIMASPGSTIQLSRTRKEYVVPAENGKYHAILVKVPFSVRIGILDWYMAKESEIRPPYAGAKTERLFAAETPKTGTVVATIGAFKSAEKRAEDSMRDNPLVEVIGQRISDPPGQMYRIQMMLPPPPALPGSNIFGPVESLRFSGAKGDVVVGADPLPSISAPADFEVMPENAPASLARPIPIRVTESSTDFDSEFSSSAKVRINGEPVTTFRRRFASALNNLDLLTAFLAALLWIGARLILAPRKRQAAN